MTEGPSPLLQEFLPLKEIAVKSLLGFSHSLGLLLSPLFTCHVHIVGFIMSMSQAYSAHCTVEHTQALGLSCCGLTLLGMVSIPPGELHCDQNALRHNAP